MGIINRTKDVSEQKEVIEVLIDDTITARVYPVYTAPRAQTLIDARNVALGLSGAPTMSLFLNRFVVGTGGISAAVGGALTVAAFGTSGAQQYSLPATGSSLLALQSGDWLSVKAAGTNAALTDNIISLVVQNVQDIKTWSF